jgi:hypothetical protein
LNEVRKPLSRFNKDQSILSLEDRLHQRTPLEDIESEISIVKPKRIKHGDDSGEPEQFKD